MNVIGCDTKFKNLKMNSDYIQIFNCMFAELKSLTVYESDYLIFLTLFSREHELYRNRK